MNSNEVRWAFQMRVETDPADRRQLRMTVASGDPILTSEYVFNSYKFREFENAYGLLILEIPFTG